MKPQNGRFVQDTLKFSHFVVSKSTFLTSFLMNLKFATSKSMFRARLSPIFSTGHKKPRLQWNLHVVTTWRSPDNAIRKTRNTTRLPHKWRWRSPKCCACHEKCNSSSENDAKVLRLSGRMLWTRYETCWNVPATRNNGTRRLNWNLQKWPLCRTHQEGTAMLPPLRTLPPKTHIWPTWYAWFLLHLDVSHAGKALIKQLRLGKRYLGCGVLPL